MAACTHSEYSHCIWDTFSLTSQGGTDFTSALGAFSFAQLPKEESKIPLWTLV